MNATEQHTHYEFYDFEVLRNITTLAVFQLANTAITVALNTQFSSTQENLTNLTPLIVDPSNPNQMRAEAKQAILAKIWEVNADNLQTFGITNPEQINLTLDLAKAAKDLEMSAKQPNATVIGFNSSHYDIPILVDILETANDNEPLDTINLRQLSDDIIVRKKSAYDIFKGDPKTTEFTVKMSRLAELSKTQGFIDMKNLNEGSAKNAPLKRIGAQAGHKIVTSDKLKDSAPPLTTLEEIADLIAYNISDNFIAYHVFLDDAYQTPFKLKTQMIERYKDTRFKNKPKLKRDSTSANMIEAVISPDEKLKDDDIVSYGYPITRNYMLNIINEEVGKPQNRTFHDMQDYLDGLTYFITDLKNMRQEQGLPIDDRSLTYALREHVENIQKEHWFLHHKKWTCAFLDDKTNYSLQFPIIVQDGAARALFDGKEALHYVFYEPLKNRVLQYYQEEQRNPNITKERFDEDENFENQYMNEFIQTVVKHYPDNDLFKRMAFYEDGRQRIVVKSRTLMIELLEYLEHNYQMGDADYDFVEENGTRMSKAYIYYKAFRGKSMKTKQERKNATASDYYKGLNLTSGAQITLPYKCPVYLSLSIGGVHGNLIDLKQYVSHMTQRQQIINGHAKIQKIFTPFLTAKTNDEWVQYFSQVQKPYGKTKKLKTFLSTKDIEQLLATKEEAPEKFIAALAKQAIEGVTPALITDPQTLTFLKEHVPMIISGTVKKANFKRIPKQRKFKDFTVTVDGRKIVHADIASYYPSVISILEIFKNGDFDNYAEMKYERVRLKNSLPKDASTWTEQDVLNNIIQTLNKLNLNSASGKADQSPVSKDGRPIKNNILVNNKILRMRICGQLILTALCIDIARNKGIPNSINTDGVFISDMELERASQLIERWTTLFGLEAEAELLEKFYSKDSNNRVEIEGNRIIASGGGDVGNYQKISLKKTSDTPGIIDNMLCDYFLTHDYALRTFDRDWMRQYLQSKIAATKQNPYEKGSIFDPKCKNEHTILGNTYLMFQYIIVSNPNTGDYKLMQNPKTGDWYYQNPINRAFFVEETIHYSDIFDASLITPIKKVAMTSQVNLDEDVYQLAQNLDILPPEGLKTNQGCAFTKIKNVTDDDLFLIQNQSVSDIPVEVLDYLDLDAYIQIAYNAWLNWARNFIENYTEENGQQIILPTYTKEVQHCE